MEMRERRSGGEREGEWFVLPNVGGCEGRESVEDLEVE